VEKKESILLELPHDDLRYLLLFLNFVFFVSFAVKFPVPARFSARARRPLLLISLHHRMKTRVWSFLVASTLALSISLSAAEADGFTPLFNGKDLSGWKIPQGDNGHWKIVDGVIDYDAESEAQGEKGLTSEKSYKDYVLKLEWRIKETPYINPNVPYILPDGSHAKDVKGKEIKLSLPDSDSGVYLRGSSKHQVNIWCWPAGSGEMYGVRMDQKEPAAARAAATPRMQADKPVGEWNSFEITVKGKTIKVVLNGKTVIPDAEFASLPDSGPVILQHHGGKRNGQWNSPPALVQFRNIAIKELK
jgi:hypothetical protein